MTSDFETFMGVVKEIRSSPDSFMKETIGRAIYFSDNPAREVFFLRRPWQPYSTFGRAVLAAPLAELAVKYCSWALAHTNYRSFSKAIHNVFFSTISEWFQKHGIVVGQHFIIDFMNDGARMSAVDKYKSTFLNELMVTCCNEVFIDGFMLECVAGGSMLPAIAFLNYIDYLDPSLGSSDRLLTVWKQNKFFDSTVHYREHDWLETTVILFSEYAGFFDSVKSDILNACKVRSSKVSSRWGQVETTITYGEQVAEWIRSAAGPGCFGLWSGASPNNTEVSSSSPHHGH